jgi:hypothetical protein
MARLHRARYGITGYYREWNTSYSLEGHFFSLDHAISNYDERKNNEMHFQSKPYVQNIILAPTCFGAAGAPSSGSPNYPDEIVRMLHHR